VFSLTLEATLPSSLGQRTGPTADTDVFLFPQTGKRSNYRSWSKDTFGKFLKKERWVTFRPLGSTCSTLSLGELLARSHFLFGFVEKLVSIRAKKQYAIKVKIYDVSAFHRNTFLDRLSEAIS
jgi:hypothetical protein